MLFILWMKNRLRPVIYFFLQKFVCTYTLNGSKCRKTFYRKSHFNTHMQKHATGFHCTICPISFASKKSLEKHVKLHKSQDEPIASTSSCNTEQQQQHACPICEKKFKHRRSMLQHKRTEHADGTFDCKKCSV